METVPEFSWKPILICCSLTLVGAVVTSVMLVNNQLKKKQDKPDPTSSTSA